jgi:hypothetical protein
MKEASHGKLHESLVRVVSGSLASSHFLPILRAQRRDHRVRLADVANGLAPRLLKTAFTIHRSLLRRHVWPTKSAPPPQVRIFWSSGSRGSSPPVAWTER